MSDKHFRLILDDEGKDIFMPCEGQSWGYRYGPTIMVHDGICEAWFASPGDGFEADWFTYRKSTDGGKTWSNEKVVLTPTGNSMDWFSVCDPAVVKYGKYYYIGYTSTLFSHAGGVCNNTYVARSLSAEGPYEKWNGNGWGEQRGDLHWVGKPAPIFYFDEEWHNWGCGEPSFVIKGDTIYIYYTWTSKDATGKGYSETRVATADITNENWPATIVQHGVAEKRHSSANDSYDVVYCEDIDKFIALSTDKRFTEESFLSVSESDDGLRFHRVNQIRTNTSFMLHNCGISGDCLHHIRTGDTMLLGYAYGNKWGNWGTRLHSYHFEAMDEEIFIDNNRNIARDHIPDKRPDPMWDINVFVINPHYLRLYEGESLEIPLSTVDHCYGFRKAPVERVKYYNYDKNIISIENGTVTAKAVGYTYVDVMYDGIFGEFPVYVDTKDTPHGVRDKTVLSFEPMITNYVIDRSLNQSRQIRGMAQYKDGTFFEICEPADGVTFKTDSDIISLAENGVVIGLKAGIAKVTVACSGFEFDVSVEVK